MLVRTNSILLFWSDFPAQPIKPLDDVPSSGSNSIIMKIYKSLIYTIKKDEQATPNSTAQSANTSIHSSEFGIVTNTTSTTLNVTTSVLQQDVQGTKTTDAVDSLSTCLHLNTAQDNIKEDGISLFNVTVDETSLLNNPIPTYYNSSTKEDTSIIYYKRREDYYPPPPRAPSITERRHK